jgi:type IV secretory pathway TrbD component
MHDPLLKVINDHIPTYDKILAVISASVAGALTIVDVQNWIAISIGLATFLAIIPRVAIGFIEWNNKADERNLLKAKKPKPRRKPPTKKP